MILDVFSNLNDSMTMIPCDVKLEAAQCKVWSHTRIALS